MVVPIHLALVNKCKAQIFPRVSVVSQDAPLLVSRKALADLAPVLDRDDASSSPSSIPKCLVTSSGHMGFEIAGQTQIDLNQRHTEHPRLWDWLERADEVLILEADRTWLSESPQSLRKHA